MRKEIIMITGACGQIGSDLVLKLREKYTPNQVIATDLVPPADETLLNGPFECLDVTDQQAISQLIKKYQPTQVYHLAAMLSATAEKNPLKAWYLNMDSLLFLLEEARHKSIEKLFFPSSIAVYGRNASSSQTPQHDPKNPSTVYGISKVAGEKWCEYYFNKYNVDVRSLRYPGLISWKKEAGGGTTDYAVDIFYKAVTEKKYTCFLEEQTRLPMMYMEDAIKATIDLMYADKVDIKVRSSYNLAALSFTPADLAQEIQRHIPDFNMSYQPDFRQAIAQSWPSSIDDSRARKDWGWQHQYELSDMVKDMLYHLENKLSVS